MIEDLLPAGWEIENPNLATSQQFGWLKQKEEADRHRDARDDRMLVFTGPIQGDGQLPLRRARGDAGHSMRCRRSTVSGMYEPEIRGVAAGGQVRVIP